MTFFPIVDECGGHFGPVDETGKVLYHRYILFEHFDIYCTHTHTYIIDELFSVRILFKMSAEFGGHQQNSAGIFSTFLTRKKQMTAEFFKQNSRRKSMLLFLHSFNQMIGKCLEEVTIESIFYSIFAVLLLYHAIWLAKDPLLANVTKRIRVVMQIFVFR